MSKDNFPVFYQIQENHLEQLAKERDNFWLILLKSTGIFITISLIVFFVVNYQFLFAQFSDYFKQKTNLVDYSGYLEDEDNDGMLDSWEKENNLDPTKDDSLLDPDKDEADNLTEYIFGTDPHNSDTDGDGYMDGEELKYKYSPNKVGRTDNDQDGIYDWWELKFGFSDKVKSDAELDNDKDGLTNFEEFVCQTDPHKKDTNHNGILDAEEASCREALSSYPPLPYDDQDKDGLSDRQEIFFGTFPGDSDSDRDGYGDFEELSRGYNPLGEGKIEAQLKIPAVNLEAPIVWSESLETDELVGDMEKGIIHHPATNFPGLRGNAFFTGHSSYYLWSGGEFKQVLEDVAKIKKDDEIIVELKLGDGKKNLVYKVAYWKIVAPDDPVIFRDFEGFELTLATCWPIGKQDERYMIKAYLVEPDFSIF